MCEPPLLWKEDAPPLHSPKEAVLGQLRGTEKRLSQDPVRANTYNQEITKLLDAGYVVKLTDDEAHAKVSSWYISRHMVHHNGKDRIVFNCSFTYQGAIVSIIIVHINIYLIDISCVFSTHAYNS